MTPDEALDLLDTPKELRGKCAWCTPCDQCVALMKRAAVEIERLQAIVDRLPKSKDGVPVEQTPMGVKVWRASGPEGKPQMADYYQNGFAVFRGSVAGELVPIRNCYSTLDAAEKARER